jgi:translation elongation factor EF-Ts
MKYNVGDRVKFLTESGGGIIRKIVGPNLVNVETEDGFEVPTMTRDIILVSANTAAEKLFAEGYDNKEEKEEAIQEKIVKGEVNTVTDDSLVSTLIVYPSDRDPNKYQMNIAFVPDQQNMPVAGELFIYLMNYSSNDALFSIHNQNGDAYNLVCSGKVPAFSKYYITSISREELDSFLSAHIQVLVLNHQSKQLYAPISADMQIRGSKFYKESSYVDDKILHQKAIIYELFKFRNIPIINQLSIAKDVDVHSTKAKNYIKNDAILKHKTERDTAVVDMHIWELVDDHSRLTNAEMLNIQLGYFDKCLRSAIDHKFKKVVFIHGVGTGKLKEEIHQLLDERDNVSYRPASMADYGVGATLVEFYYE